MRVLMVTGSFPPLRCGVGDYTAVLTAALAREPGTELAVLTSLGSGALPDKKVVVYPLMGNWSIAELALFVRVVNRFAPDVVHVQYPTQGYGRGRVQLLLPWMARLLGRRVVVTWHEPMADSLKGTAEALLTMAAGSVVVVRENYLALIGRWQALVAKSRPMRFIPNATSIPEVRLSEDGKAEERTRHRVAAHRRLVVFFGFVLPNKGVEFLFTIADRARDHLLIIGDGIPGFDLMDRLKAQSAADGWAEHVTFAGFLPSEEVGRALAAADAVVLPYRQGAGNWNTSVHAVQIQGTFLVTTSQTRSGDDAAHNTWWCAPDDISAMRAALTSGIGRKSAPAKLTGWKEISEQHMAVYRAIAGNACLP